MSEGKKVPTSFDEINKTGEFLRKPTSFHGRVSAADVQPGRFHLYISLACPWACRCYATLKLKGISTDVVPVHVVQPVWGVVDAETGGKSWVFGKKGELFAGVDVSEPLYGFSSLRELYLRNDASYAGKFTVPVLWDSVTQTIVNNESSEILRMLNSEFQAHAARPALDLSPVDLLAEIDAMNDSFYNSLNNGVYRAGFAKTQAAYETAVAEVFERLDILERHLAKHDFLVGDRLTESDVRLFVTLVRFDAVYVGHFKCNLRTIANDYPTLQRFVRRLHQNEFVGATVNIAHIKNHYYGSHPGINPLGIVPAGPVLHFDALKEAPLKL
jgi:putative glutathione S-transferase